MTKQMMFYERAVPVTRDRHGDLAVEVGADYGFARSANSVPLTAIEIPAAADEYAVVFAGPDDALLPVAVLGARPEENLYVTGEGRWRARYVPGFVRRYPFVFSTSGDGQVFTLCVDEEFRGCNRAGHGQRLFDAAGERTGYLTGVLKFLSDYEAEFRRTKELCRKLHDLGLLESAQTAVTLPSGEKLTLGGFKAISRDKLNNLPGDQLSELAKTGALELIYAHLRSLRNLGKLMDLVRRTAAGAKGAAAKRGNGAHRQDDGGPQEATQGSAGDNKLSLN